MVLKIENITRARESGASDRQILDAIAQRDEKLGAGIQKATAAGATEDQILQSISSRLQEEPTIAQQAGRTAGQFAIGAAEAAAIPYDVAVAPLANKPAQIAAYRETLTDDLNRLLDQKQTGIFDEEDQALLDHTIEQLNNSKLSEKYVKTADASIQGLAEKATGVDFTPKGALEKGARWTGWIKNPANWANLAKSGLSKGEFIKAVMPTGKEAFKGAAAGTALELAEQNEFGPIGTLAVSIASDVAAGKLVDAGKQTVRALKNPKQAAANALASFTKGDQKTLQQAIINDFRDAGLQADLGTITDNNIVKMVQSKLAASGLTGKPLQELRETITKDIIEEYQNIAGNLGQSRFESTFEAGQSMQTAVKRLRQKDLDTVRSIYDSARSELPQEAKVFTDRLLDKTEGLVKKLTPGGVKSAEQKAVLDRASALLQDLKKVHPEGRTGLVEDLINNKHALNDVINYEVQGGAKQLLKEIVGELDRAIISYGSQNPKFAKEFIRAQKEFARHAKTFRNKNISQVIFSEDPGKLMTKMNTVQGIRDVKKALSGSETGRELFNDLKRYKLDEVIGKNMVDSTTQQIKMGTFSKLLEKGKNAEVIKEILGSKDFKRLQRLQKNSGRLADSANKFLNTSQTAVAAADGAMVLRLFKDAFSLLGGNPWPLFKSAGGVQSARKISQLMADPTFLKLVEEGILAAQSGSNKKMGDSILKLIPYARAYLEINRD